MADPLYCKFNSRGKKQFKNLERSTFVENYPEYAKLGLPAHKAALGADIDCLKDCFSSCSSQGVPSRDVNGATPLHLAVRKNQKETVKWLIRFTDLSPIDTAKHGETPAHVAAAQGHLDSLKQLLTVDMTSNTKSGLCTIVDNSGFSVLHLAIVKHQNECAKLLINELGSKAINALNDSGVTAAHISASAGNVEILRFLSNKYKKLLTQEDKQGASPLYYAAQEGRLEALKFLYEKAKCNMFSQCTDGLQPIHAASQCGHIYIIKYIVACCGNQVIFESTPDGATPLHFATSSGRVKVAEWLINSDTGVTLVNKKDGNGDTPAHDAAESGDITMLKLLLESGADLYSTNNDGNTPYSIALSGGNMDTANYVMTYASKSPQRDSGGPVKIFNLQGEMDTVDISATNTERSQDDNDQDVTTTSLPPPESSYPQTNINVFMEKKDKKKEKKETKKEKKDAKKSKKPQHPVKDRFSNSNSFMDSTAQTLQSLNSTLSPLPGDIDNKQGVDLSMTDEELALFNDDVKNSEDPEDDSIVVSYSSGGQTANHLIASDEPAEPGYATVQEIALMEEKKEHKLGRKISKSLAKAIKSGSGIQGTESKSPTRGFEDNAMGFKPQFRSNPLQRLGHGSIPPTPPPTPATGASIAPSDETPPQILADVDEMEDGSGYNPYSVPDPEVVKIKAEKRQTETSENQKLLKDALQDLSGDESPPQIPKRSYEDDNSNNVPSKVSLNSNKSSSANSTTMLKKTANNKTSKGESDEVPEGLRIKLKSPQIHRAQPRENNGSTTELSNIKLKRTSDWKRAKYSHPETETTSGASDELRHILKKKVF